VARRTSRTALRTAAFVVAAAAILAVVRPWTVRPLVAPVAAFDAPGYAGQAWPRIVEEASRTALDLGKGLQAPAASMASPAPGRRSVFVTFTGTLAAVDRRSRVGVARVTLGGGSLGSATVQIGPVIRGTALRDAVSFIRFNDFANQFEFAAVSNALHDRVLRDVVGALDLEAVVGQSVTVLGAATVPPATPPEGVLEIVPLRITIAGGRR
jgi:predicted lipoprotein